MGTLIPAYGRDYTSKKKLEEAFNSNKDFIDSSIFSGQYVNKSDLLRMGVKQVTIRYANKRKVALVKVRP